MTYGYDALGNLIQRQAWAGGPATTERYGLDGWDTAQPEAVGNENFRTWAVLDGSNSLVTRYLSGPVFGIPVAAETGAGVVSWYSTDLQGSVRQVLDNSGSVSSSFTFDAWGNLTSGTLTIRYGFQGGAWDPTARLYHFADRFYDPLTATWTSEDPIGLRAGPNPHEFVGNAPTLYSDPSGLEPPALADGYERHFRTDDGSPLRQEVERKERVERWWASLSAQEQASWNRFINGPAMLAVPGSGAGAYNPNNLKADDLYREMRATSPVQLGDVQFNVLDRAAREWEAEQIKKAAADYLANLPARGRSLYPEEEFFRDAARLIGEPISRADLAVLQLVGADLPTSHPDPYLNELVGKVRGEYEFALKNGASDWEARQYAFYIYSPLTRWQVELEQAGRGVSLHAADYGRQLSPGERALKALGAGLDLFAAACGGAALTGELRAALSPATGGLTLGAKQAEAARKAFEGVGERAARMPEKPGGPMLPEGREIPVPPEVQQRLAGPSKLTYDASPKHGTTVRPMAKGVSSPAPTNGQAALENSIQVKPTSDVRVGVDRATGEIVVFRETFPGSGIFHGYVPGWANLHPDMQRALIKAGLVTQKGKVK